MHSACPSEPDEDRSAQDWEEFEPLQDLDVAKVTTLIAGNLAESLKRQGKYGEAEKMEGRAPKASALQRGCIVASTIPVILLPEAKAAEGRAPKASALQRGCIIGSTNSVPVILLPPDDDDADDADDAETIRSVASSTSSAYASERLPCSSPLSGRSVSSLDDLEECQEQEELEDLRTCTPASDHSTSSPPLDRLPSPPLCPLLSQRLAHVEAGGEEVEVGLV